MTMTMLEDEVVSSGGMTDDARFGHCYYLRPDGWIMVGQANDTAVANYRSKGIQALLEFGRFPLNPPVRVNAAKQPMPQWQPLLDPWDHLLLQQGGPELFPVEQVVAFGWHRGKGATWYEYTADGGWRQHRRRIEFPQLFGLQVADANCGVCGKVFGAVDLETAEALARQHTSIAHPERGTLLAMAETQRAIAGAMGSAVATADPALVAILTRMAETQEQLVAAQAEQAARMAALEAAPAGRKGS